MSDIGLDMYLTKETFLFDRKNNYHTFASLGSLGIRPSKVKAIREEAMYWRKANAIHAWFVEHVQEGNDDCQQHEVSLEQLEELLALVKRVSNNRNLAAELLPTESGFFFGTQDYDEWYWEDLEKTKVALQEIVDEERKAEKDESRKNLWVSYYYQSSW